MNFVENTPEEISQWIYELAIGEDGISAGIRDLSPGEAYGAIFLPTDNTQHGHDFRIWNNGSSEPVVDDNDPLKKRLIRSTKNG